jgi:hypothetical protein
MYVMQVEKFHSASALVLYMFFRLAPGPVSCVTTNRGQATLHSPGTLPAHDCWTLLGGPDRILSGITHLVKEFLGRLLVVQEDMVGDQLLWGLAQPLEQ